MEILKDFTERLKESPDQARKEQHLKGNARITNTEVTKNEVTTSKIWCLVKIC